ncbi:alpha-N-arabinofuranosidase [Candidatus Sumerlaeota bacterium]|nr:alpha-N-arabinofuranosidase [Candidatus Sumerlaeota bacterium]
MAQVQAADQNKLIIHADQGKDRIEPEIYGQFAEHLGRCIYDGIWVGEDSEIPNIRGLRKDVVEALQKLEIPILRWPGGCFADEYHWREGIGPKDQRPRMVNTNWGMITENNHFGTHEFLDLCELLGCEAYIAGNVGSGTPEELQDWIEYMTFDGDSEMALLRKQNGREEPWKVKWIGIGNENWGCGGNMTAEYYSDLYRRFATFVHAYPGNEIVKVGCGPGGAGYDWMDTVLERAGRYMNAISMHYYVFTGPDWDHQGSAIDFSEKEWFILIRNTLRCDEVIQNFIQILNARDPEGRIDLLVDEWGTWWDPIEGQNELFCFQQNTVRDAVSCAIFFNLFHKHCYRIKMSNIAQTVNVLQAMILTEGGKMTVTPTYHVFEMYKVFQGATYLPSEMECADYSMDEQSFPALHASVGRAEDGTVHVAVANLDPNNDMPLTCEFDGYTPKSASGRVLTADTMNAHNTFDDPDRVQPVALENIQLEADGRVVLQIPSKSVCVVTFE